MVANQVSSLISLLRSKSTLQKTLRVISFINCMDNHYYNFLELIVKEILLTKEVIIFKDIYEEHMSKSITIVDKDVRYLLGKNIFCDDIFKSKYNQDILKIAGVMSEHEFKSLDSVIIDATSIIKKFPSKISKISDNILILANTSQDSLNDIIDKVGYGKLSGQEVQIIFINDDNDLDWQYYFENFEKNVRSKCDVDLKIMDIIDKRFFSVDLYKLSERVYLNSVNNEVSKSSNFLDFIINILN